MMNSVEIPKGINYKINENGSYYVITKEWNGKTFYNVKIQQTNVDGTKSEFSRQLRFIKCEPPQDGDKIKILSGFESNYVNSKDPYNCITCICVTDWQLAETIEKEKNDAINKYNNSVETEDIVIRDSDFPF